MNQEFFLMGKEEAVSAIEHWLAQAFELRSGSILPRREVYDAYLSWCCDHNVEATAQSAFGKILHRVFPTLQSRRMGGKGRHVMCYQDFAHKTGGSSAVAPTPSTTTTSTTTTASSFSSRPASVSSSAPSSASSSTLMRPPATVGALRPNRASSPASLGARSATAQPQPLHLTPSPPQHSPPLIETLSRSAPTPLAQRHCRSSAASSLHNSGEPGHSLPSSPDCSQAVPDCDDDKGGAWKWQQQSTVVGSRKRGRNEGSEQKAELARRISQRSGTTTAMKEEGEGDDADGANAAADASSEMDEEKAKEKGEKVIDDDHSVDGVHLERLHMTGGAGGRSEEEQERAQLQTWLERDFEDDIRLLKQNEPVGHQLYHHQQAYQHHSAHLGAVAGMGHHLLQDTFGFAAGGDLFSHLQPMARRLSASPPRFPIAPSQSERMAAEGTTWYRSTYSFPTLSFTHPLQHPWVVCPFFASVAFMRQGLRGDHLVRPLSDHFIRLTEHYLEGDLGEAINLLACARDEISRVFDATSVEVAWSLLCLTWWTRLLLRGDESQSRCAYYLALARQMCVQLQLPSGHDVAVSAHLSPLLPRPPAGQPFILATSSSSSSSSLPLSPPSSSPSLGLSPFPSSSSLPPPPQFGGASRSLTHSPPPPSSAPRLPPSASAQLPSDLIGQVSRELHACKTMMEHVDPTLPYCKIENDLLQCFIIAFDLVLLHARGPSASVASAAVSLVNHLLYLPPSLLAAYIFELSLKERILEIVLGLLTQYVMGSQTEALYHSLGAMHSLLPVARAMELMRLSVRTN